MGILSHPHIDKAEHQRLNEALDHYAASHQHRENIRMHLVCVPVIFTSSLTLLWRLLGGQGLSSEPGLGLWMLPGGVITLLALAFYARFSLRVLGVMVAWTLASLALMFAMLGLEWPVTPMMLVAFVVAWIGQFIGHRIEGRRPAFLEDLRQLLIGPLFVLVELFPDMRGWLLRQDEPTKRS